MTLLKLAERCERANGRDIDLDAEIACFAPICQAHYVLFAEPSRVRRGMVTRHFDSGSHGTFVSEPYTTSLDAAMTLVPDDMATGVHRFLTRPCLAEVYDGMKCVGQGNAATPALALCAAALRARAAIADGTATAAANEDLPVPQDCQARAARHRPDTPSLQTPQGGDS